MTYLEDEKDSEEEYNEACCQKLTWVWSFSALDSKVYEVQAEIWTIQRTLNSIFEKRMYYDFQRQ